MMGQFLKKYAPLNMFDKEPQPAFTFSKLTIESLQQGVEYVQS